MIGPGKALDTDRWFVVCSNLLGGCRGTTGPSTYGPDVPVITVSDMVRAQRAWLRELGIERVLCVAGGSLGGMLALDWAVAHPDEVRGAFLTASTARLDTQGVALNAIAREAIMSDPDWQGGAYYGTGREPKRGMGVARMIGHVTYLSKQSLDEQLPDDVRIVGRAT